MGTANRVAKNTLILYARMGITMFISLYATRLVLAALGASDFGIFNVVAGSIAMLTFLNATMASASQRFMSYSQGKGEVELQTTIFSISVILHFLIGVAIVILLEISYLFIFDYVLNIAPERLPIARIVYQFMVFNTFFIVISVPYDAVINAHENMLFVAVLGVVEAIFKLSIAFVITYTQNDKLLLYSLLLVASSLVLLMVRRFYCHIKYPEVVTNVFKYFNRDKFREMTAFAGWSILTGISSMFSSHGKNIIVNIYFGTSVNAAQGVTTQIVGQLSAFSTILLKALNPVITKSEGAGDRQGMLRAALTGGKLSFFLLFIVSIPVIIEMPFILSFWLKEVPEFTIAFCRLTLLTFSVGQLTITLITSISAVGEIKWFQITMATFAIIPFSVSFLLFHYGFSPVSLYYTYFITEILKSGIIVFYANKLVKMDVSYFYSKIVGKSIFVALLVYLVSTIPHLYLPSGFIRLLIVGCVTIISFIFSLLLFGLSVQEKLIVSNAYKRFKKR